MQHLRFEELSSTNACLLEQLKLKAACAQDGCVVSCGFQGAGRGQAGNSWESEAGANALFSVALRGLQLPATEHFVLTQISALAVVDIVENALLSGACLPSLREGKHALSIKWPNDIYYADKKLAGILIESQIYGSRIQDCVCGIGLNVRQTKFLSDAPNPISLAQIIEQEQIPGENAAFIDDIPNLIERIAEYILQLKNDLQNGRLTRENLQNRYLAKLYRLREWHFFLDANGRFEGRILDILPDGRLQMETSSSEPKTYTFKELKFII